MPRLWPEAWQIYLAQGPDPLARLVVTQLKARVLVARRVLLLLLLLLLPRTRAPLAAVRPGTAALPAGCCSPLVTSS